MAQFLSDEWVAAARRVYEESPPPQSEVARDVQINLIVKDAPFGDGTVQAHLDTTGAEPTIDVGHIDGAPTTVTTDYTTAKTIFVEQDQQAAMQAFMAGKIQITGDMTKIMMMMQAPRDAASAEVVERIKALTD